MNSFKYVRYPFLKNAAFVAVAVFLTATMMAWFGEMMVGQISRTLYESQQERVGYVLSTVEQRMGEMETAANQLLFDSNLQVLAKSRKPYTPHQRALLVDFNRNLTQFIASHSAWDNVALYFHKTEYAQEGIYWRSLDMIHRDWDYAVEWEEWQKMLLEVKQTRYLSFQSKANPNQRYAEIWFPIATPYQDYRGAMIIRLDTASMVTLLRGGCSSEEEELSLLDKDGNLICTTASAGYQPNLENYSYAHSNPSKGGWTCVSMLDMDFLTRPVAFCRRLMMISFVLVIVIGVAVGLFSVKRSYQPVEQIYRVVAENRDFSAKPRSGMEASRFISEAYQELAESYDSAQNNLLKQRIYVRNHLLARLISPTWSGEVGYSADIYTENGVVFPTERFFVLMIVCQDAKKRFMEEKGKFAEDDTVTHQRITSLFESVFHERYNAMFIIYDSSSIGILNVPDDCIYEDIARSVEQECLRLSREIEAEFGLNLNFYLSSMVTGATELHEAAKECFETDDYLQVSKHTKERFVHCARFLKSIETDEKSDVDEAELHTLKLALNEGNFSNVRLLAEKTFEKAETEGETTEGFLRVSSFVNALIRLLNESGEAEKLNLPNRILNCTSISMLHAEVDRILNDVERLPGEDTSHVQCDALLERVLEYVNANYSDCNLSVSELAERAQMSLSGLSRAFKKKMGCNLLDYINQLRVKAVLRELNETDLTLVEIAEKTGYTNTNTMCRNFKHYVGTTPGKYKKFSRQAYNDSQEKGGFTQ